MAANINIKELGTAQFIQKKIPSNIQKYGQKLINKVTIYLHIPTYIHVYVY